MSMLEPRTAEPVDAAQAARIGGLLAALREAADDASTAGDGTSHMITVDGRELEVAASVYDVIVDVLQRFAQGTGVVVGSADVLLTSSQAAKLLGVSATYMLRLLDAGRIPVEYRGTHRRVRLADATAYLESKARGSVAGETGAVENEAPPMPAAQARTAAPQRNRPGAARGLRR